MASKHEVISVDSFVGKSCIHKQEAIGLSEAEIFVAYLNAINSLGRGLLRPFQSADGVDQLVVWDGP